MAKRSTAAATAAAERKPAATKQAKADNAVASARPGLWTEGRRHLLDLDDMSRPEIEEILRSADGMKEVLSRNVRKTPALRGKTIITLFFENSTRTRVSFERRGVSGGLCAYRVRGTVVALRSEQAHMISVRRVKAVA